MLANIANATTNIIPSIVRNGIRSAFDLWSTVIERWIKEWVGWATKAIKDAKLSQIVKSVWDERVDARLRWLGAINEFNIDNASPYSKLEWKLMYITNGTWAGNLSTCIDKIEVSLRNIESILFVASNDRKISKKLYKEVMGEMDVIKEYINEVDEDR